MAAGDHFDVAPGEIGFAFGADRRLLGVVERAPGALLGRRARTSAACMPCGLLGRQRLPLGPDLVPSPGERLALQFELTLGFGELASASASSPRRRARLAARAAVPMNCASSFGWAPRAGPKAKLPSRPTVSRAPHRRRPRSSAGSARARPGRSAARPERVEVVVKLRAVAQLDRDEGHVVASCREQLSVR